MNEYQRQRARRKRKSSGYAHGGVVGAVSHGMERTGRFFGTEKARTIQKAESFVREGSDLKHDDLMKKAMGVRRASQIEEAEQKALGYKHGGKVRR